MIGGPQIILIVIVVLLLFGGRKIPELMRGLGSGIKEFKKATKEDEEEDSKTLLMIGGAVALGAIYFLI